MTVGRGRVFALAAVPGHHPALNTGVSIENVDPVTSSIWPDPGLFGAEGLSTHQ